MNDTGIVAVFTGIRKPFQLREFPVPRPEPGAILVEVRMANVCGSDLHIWRGEYDVYRGQSEPFCLSIGHEMVGRIAALGEGVTARLGRGAAGGRRPGGVSVFLSVRRVSKLSHRADAALSEGAPLSLSADGVPAFQRRVWAILLPPQAAGRVQGARQRAGRPGGAGQLCTLAGHRRIGARGRGTGRFARHPGGGRTGHQCDRRRERAAACRK